MRTWTLTLTCLAVLAGGCTNLGYRNQATEQQKLAARGTLDLAKRVVVEGAEPASPVAMALVELAGAAVLDTGEPAEPIDVAAIATAGQAGSELPAPVTETARQAAIDAAEKPDPHDVLERHLAEAGWWTENVTELLGAFGLAGAAVAGALGKKYITKARQLNAAHAERDAARDQCAAGRRQCDLEQHNLNEVKRSFAQVVRGVDGVINGTVGQAVAGDTTVGAEIRERLAGQDDLTRHLVDEVQGKTQAGVSITNARPRAGARLN